MARRKKSPERVPGHWYGLKEIDVTHENGDLLAKVTTYRLGKELSDLLRLAPESEIRVTEKDGSITGVFGTSRHTTTVEELTEIKSELESVLLLRILGTEE